MWFRTCAYVCTHLCLITIYQLNSFSLVRVDRFLLFIYSFFCLFFQPFIILRMILRCLLFTLTICSFIWIFFFAYSAQTRLIEWIQQQNIECAIQSKWNNHRFKVHQLKCTHFHYPNQIKFLTHILHSSLFHKLISLLLSLWKMIRNYKVAKVLRSSRANRRCCQMLDKI